MPTTPAGIYYPSGTDKVRLGPAQMQGMAESIDAVFTGYRPNSINGMTPKVIKSTGNIAGNTSPTTAVTTGAWTLTASTDVEFHASWGAMETSSDTITHVVAYIQLNSGLVVTGLRQLCIASNGSDDGPTGALFGVATLAAGNYSASLKFLCGSGSCLMKGGAAPPGPITLMAKPI